MTSPLADATSRRDDVGARQQFVSDVFHAISQPLTALRCSIELALMHDGTAESHRAALEDALHHAERVTACAEFLRLMAEADDSGQPTATNLVTSVTHVVEEFALVFESNSRMLATRFEACPTIFADPEKLQRALFLVLDFCAAERSHAVLRVRRPAELHITCGRSSTHAGESSSRAQQSLALAERMFRAIGANVRTAHEKRHRRLIATWRSVGS